MATKQPQLAAGDRGTNPAFHRSPRWRAVARAHLAQHPSCAACGSEEDTVAHHIVPVHVDPKRELEPDNLITLCQGETLNCHLWCGHLGHWKSWNTTVVRDAARFLARVKARPFKPPDPPDPPPAAAAALARAA